MEGLGRRLAHRLAVLVFLLFAVAFGVFLLPHLGSKPALVMLGGPQLGVERAAELRAAYALDQPLPVQFVRHVLRLLQGDLGESWLTGTEVAGELAARLPATVELMVAGMALGGLFGVPLGVAAALARKQAENRAARSLALLAEAVPVYLLGLCLVLVLHVWMKIAPAPSGRISVLLSPPPPVTGSHFVDAVLIQDGAVARSALGQLVLPVLCIAIAVAAALMHRVEAATRAQLTRDHLALARAQGMRQEAVAGMAMRSALPAIAAAIGSQLAGLIAVVAVVEHVFSWGGIGQVGIEALVRGDMALAQGFLLYAALFCLALHVVRAVIRLVPGARRMGA